MQTTPNYGFNIVEGTDVVNPLVQLNPNFSALDTDLKVVSDATYDKATCVKSGTNHAVTRTDTDKNLIIFTATGNWETGDTMTIDGSPVSVYLPDGTAPLTGSFIINTEVLVVLNGTRVTLYTSQELPGYTASDINYDNSQSGLSASDVQDAIDEIAMSVNKGNVLVTGNGIKTITTLLNELYNLIDIAKVNKDSKIVWAGRYFTCNTKQGGVLSFSRVYGTNTSQYIINLRLEPNDGSYEYDWVMTGSGNTGGASSDIVPAGVQIILYY